jgi:hypothetical protein
MASLTDSVTIAKARESAQKIINSDPMLSSYPELAKKLSELEKIYIND